MAKKDLFKDNILSLDNLRKMNLQESEIYVNKKTAFKKPNYQSMLDAGTPRWKLFLIKEFYNKIPALPNYKKAQSNEARAQEREKFVGIFGEALNKILAFNTFNEFKEYSIKMYPGNPENLYYNIPFNALYPKFRNKPTTEEIIEEYAEQTKFLVEEYKKHFLIYKEPKFNQWLVSRRKYKDGVDNKKHFETEQEAIQWAKDNIVKDTRKPKAKKEVVASGVEEPTDRIGKDWREGRDISTDELLDTFGFRGGEFGNWVNQNERQQSLNASYDALRDLADMLGIPPRAISLNGQLAIAFGARGTGKYFAHYEPARIVINLTKIKGGGVLAHEWAHALDDYFGRQGADGRPGQYLSEWTYGRTNRREILDSYEELMDKIKYKNDTYSNFYKRAIDEGEYWSSGRELFARAFAAFIVNKTNNALDKSPYLVRYSDQNEELMTPQGDEAERIYTAMQNLFNTIQYKLNKNANEEVQVELYQVGPLYTGSSASYDRPSTDFIGTGEGAQAFGWGLYASEIKHIAKWYAEEDAERKKRIQMMETLYFNDNPIPKPIKFRSIIEKEEWIEKSSIEEQMIQGLGEYFSTYNDKLKIDFNLLEEWFKNFQNGVEIFNLFNKLIKSKKISIENVYSRMSYKGGPISEEPFEARSRDEDYDWHESHTTEEAVLNRISTFLKYNENEFDLDDIAEDLKDPNHEEWIEFFNENIDDFKIMPIPEVKRHLYKQTAFKDFEESIISWYEPITEDIYEKILSQATKENSDLIQENENGVKSLKDIKIGKTGHLTYINISRSLGSDKEASQFLDRAGIHGIKYPVHAASGARDEENGYNYVIFNDKNLIIDEHIMYQNMMLNNDELKSESQKLYTFNENFNRAVMKYINTGKAETEIEEVGETPLAFLKIGIPNQTIGIKSNVIKKGMDGKHHLTKEQMRQIPVALYNPVMIFKSSPESTNPNGYVVVTQIQDEFKRPIVVVLNVEKQNKNHIVTDIASIHPRNNKHSITDWIEQGLLRYVNKKRFQNFARSTGLQLPKEATLIKKSHDNTILDESPNVKPFSQNNLNFLHQNGLNESIPTTNKPNGLSKWRADFNAWRKTADGQPLEYCRFARDNHIRITPPTSADGEYYKDLWLKLPSDLKGNMAHGTPIDIFHRDLDFAGFNVKDISPWDLLESMHGEYKLQLETFSAMNKITQDELEEMKRYEKFDTGKTSELIPNSFLEEMFFNSQNAKISFTIMDVPYTLDFDFGKIIAKSPTGETIDLSNYGEQVRIDSASLRVGSAKAQTPKAYFGARGYTQEYNNLYAITLLEKSDVSTVLHELNHVWMYNIANLVQKGMATEETQNMYQSIRDWAFEQIPDELVALYRQNMDNFSNAQNPVVIRTLQSYEEYCNTNNLPKLQLESAELFINNEDTIDFNQVVFFERFARANEAYLMQGVAPSNKLKYAFKNLNKWLLNLYMDSKSLNVQVSEEIHAIFERMHATKIEIDKRDASIEGQIQILSKKFKVGKDIVESLLALSKQLKEVTNEMVMKQITSELANKSSEMKERFGKQYNKRPQNAIKNYCIENGCVNSDELASVIDSNSIQRLIEIGVASENGILNPKEVAEKFNWRADFAFNQIANLPSTEDYVKQQFDVFSQEYARKRTNELLENQALINSTKKEAELSQDLKENKIALIHKFFVELNKKKFDTQFNESIRTLALSQLAELTQGEILKSNFMNQFEKYTKEAGRLSIRGDFKGAESAYLLARLNLSKHRYQQNLKNTLDNDARQLKKLVHTINRNVGKTGGLDGDYASAIIHILAQIGIINNDFKATDEYKKSVKEGKDPLRLIINNKSIYDLLGDVVGGFSINDESRSVEELQEVMPEWYNDISKLNTILNLKVDEFRKVKSTIKELKQIGRVDKSELRYFDKDIKEVAQQFMDELEPMKNAKKLFFSSFVAAHNTLPTILRRISNLKEGKISTELLKGLSNASEKEYALTDKVNKKMSVIIIKLNELNAKFDASKIKNVDIPRIFKEDLQEKLTFENIFAMLLNSGNAENFQRLRDGLYKKEINEILKDAKGNPNEVYKSFNKDVEHLISYLPEEAFQLAQDVWNIFEYDINPSYSKMFERVNFGRKLVKVKPTPKTFVASNGKKITLQGGYYPVSYDTRVNTGVKQEDKNVLAQANHTKRPDASASKERHQSVRNSLLKLAFSVAHREMVNQIHYATHFDIISDFSRLLQEDSVQSVLNRKFGIENYRYMKRAIDYIGAGQLEEPNSITAMMQFIRKRIFPQLLAFNPRTALVQFTALPAVSVDIGSQAHFRGLQDVSKNPIAAYQWVIENDATMKQRYLNIDVITHQGYYDENANKLHGKIYNKSKIVIESLTKWGMNFSLVAPDIAITLPIYRGVYLTELEALAKEKGVDVAMLSEKDIENAKFKAREAVALAQPVGRRMDKSYAQYSKTMFQLFNPFISFVARSSGALSERGRMYFDMMKNGEISKIDYAKYLFAESLLIPAFELALIMMATLRPPDEDDWKRYLMKCAEINTTSFAVVRDIASLAIKYIADEPIYTREIARSLMIETLNKPASWVIDSINEIQDTDKTKAQKQKHDEKLTRISLDALSFVTGIPVSRLYANTKEGIRQIEEEDAALSAILIPDPTKRKSAKKKKK